MKYFGSILDFTHERNADLIRAFRERVAAVKVIRLDEIAADIVNSPSKRFWVSEARAAVVCSQIARGLPILDSMLPSKRELFSEVYARVSAIRAAAPERSLIDVVSEVVNSPAPKFYMEPSSALERIFKIRSGWYGPEYKKYLDS